MHYWYLYGYAKVRRILNTSLAIINCLIVIAFFSSWITFISDYYFTTMNQALIILWAPKTSCNSIAWFWGCQFFTLKRTTTILFPQTNFDFLGTLTSIVNLFARQALLINQCTGVTSVLITFTQLWNTKQSTYLRCT